MIFAALLLVIAILLFGSSAVVGVIGSVLGFIAAVAAIACGLYHAALSMIALGFSADDAPLVIILIICGLFAVGRLALYVIDRRR